MAFYVYIVTNQRNGTLYIGHTDDIGRRAYEHRNGILRGFASKYGCRRLVWYDTFGTRDAAQTRERQMKAWRRDWKIALIEKDNPGWRDLIDDLHPLGARHYRMPHSPAAMDPDFRQEGVNFIAENPIRTPPQRKLGPMAAGESVRGFPDETR